MDWARRLERVEKEKARERQGTRTDIVENFPPSSSGKARDIVGEASGFGSGKQYEKAKFIADNADDETIAKLDEGASKRSNENVWHNATPTSYVTNSSQSVKNFLNLSQFWAVFWVCIVNGEND